MERRCIACRGLYQREGDTLKHGMWDEPKSGEDSSPVRLEGWICEECFIVHWAWGPEQ